ncbi:MAG TPA: glycosyltransferase [Candidatus Binatia bacterium]|nr:glycosyltransferase [Candidatus Binatia bacterium]
MKPLFSIIIATYDRVDFLRGLLAGIAAHFGKLNISHEVIVANNARDERIAEEIAKLTDEFRNSDRIAFRHVREPLAGKCRAQNVAIRAAKGSIMVFFDDDIEVTPDWLTVAGEFFQRQEFDAMQGPILMPPEMEHNQELLRAQQRFRTINFVKYRPGVTQLKTLTGANIAVRRAVFTRIGYFNEDLGPGRSGISEDVEFAQRLVKSGGRIGYEPRAGVYHRVDWSRLTEEFFRQRHEQQGRSRLIYKKQSLLSIVPNFLRSIWTFGWYSLVGNERKKYRAKGRYFHYRAMLAVKARKITGIHD